MLSYYKQKYECTDAVFRTIDWEAFGKSFGKTKGLRKITMTKLIQKWQPVNAYIQRDEKRPVIEAQCAECIRIDDLLQYMQCRSRYFVNVRRNVWRNFQVKMKRYSVHATLFQHIWIGIQNFVYNDFDERLPKGDIVSLEQYKKLAEAYEQQTAIGWEHLLLGRISILIGEYFHLTIDDDIKTDGRVLSFTRALIGAM